MAKRSLEISAVSAFNAGNTAGALGCNDDSERELGMGAECMICRDAGSAKIIPISRRTPQATRRKHATAEVPGLRGPHAIPATGTIGRKCRRDTGRSLIRAGASLHRRWTGVQSRKHGGGGHYAKLCTF